MKAPRFWFNSPERMGLWPRMLAPLSLIWRWASARRMRSGSHHRLPVPVICVGNINVGGTGKTPTTIELALMIQGMGREVHILSRGYGGRLTGPVQVDIARHSADDVGDEPLLLAAFAPCWVAQSRLEGGKAAVAAGAQVLLLDDGMQNPDLIKDFNVMVVDADVGFGNERLLPAGPLRQTVDTGLRLSDVVLGIGSEIGRKTLCARVGDAEFVGGHLQPLETGMDWKGLRAFAFAGIGRPEKFFDTLRDVGADVVATRSFGDHQKIPLALLKRMQAEAAQLGAQLVTTEKDAARLPKQFKQEVLTLPVRLAIEDPEALSEMIARVLLQDTPELG